MRVEVWPTQLRLDLDDWQEALEASLSVRDNGLSYESPTMPKQSIAVPAGRYGLRVAGAGSSREGGPAPPDPVTSGGFNCGRKRGPWLPVGSGDGHEPSSACG